MRVEDIDEAPHYTSHRRQAEAYVPHPVPAMWPSLYQVYGSILQAGQRGAMQVGPSAPAPPCAGNAFIGRLTVAVSKYAARACRLPARNNFDCCRASPESAPGEGEVAVPGCEARVAGPGHHVSFAVCSSCLTVSQSIK